MYTVHVHIHVYTTTLLLCNIISVAYSALYFRGRAGCLQCIYVLMRDGKEGRKKQAMSNKQQGKATQYTLE